MFDARTMEWSRPPQKAQVTKSRVLFETEPHTDLWQRTYYHFRNDSAPVLQFKTCEKFFSFTVKAQFDYRRRFDQAGVALYLGSDSWLKGSIEYEDGRICRLGAVVTNRGYSDWSSTDISPVREMWFRLSRREDDFCIENSEDGVIFHQMRIAHMFDLPEEISLGIYACSPEESSFEAVFTDLQLTECKWRAHDGQPPDAEA